MTKKILLFVVLLLSCASLYSQTNQTTLLFQPAVPNQYNKISRTVVENEFGCNLLYNPIALSILWRQKTATEYYQCGFLTDNVWDKVMYGEKNYDDSVHVFGCYGSGIGQYIKPRDIAPTPWGDIFITDEDGGRVLWAKYNYNNYMLLPYSLLNDGHLSSPKRIAIDDGFLHNDPNYYSIWVTDSELNKIINYAYSNGSYLYNESYTAVGDVTINNPDDIAICNNGGNGVKYIYIIDSNGTRLILWARDFMNHGESVAIWSAPNRCLTSIEIDYQGQPWVTDNNGHIIKFECCTSSFASLIPIIELCSPGVDIGQLMHPKDITIPPILKLNGSVNKSGDVFICEDWTSSTGFQQWTIGTDAIDISYSYDNTYRIAQISCKYTDQTSIHSAVVVNAATGQIMADLLNGSTEVASAGPWCKNWYSVPANGGNFYFKIVISSCYYVDGSPTVDHKVITSNTFSIPAGQVTALHSGFEYNDVVQPLDNSIYIANGVPWLTRWAGKEPNFAHSGTYSFTLLGEDATTSTNDYCYAIVFDRQIAILDTTYLTFWRKVSSSPSNMGRLFIDGVTTDGLSFRDSYVNNTYLCDQNGLRARPDVTRLYNTNQWQRYSINLSSLVGKNIRYVLLGYDDIGSESGNFCVHIDDVSISGHYPYKDEWFVSVFGGVGGAAISFQQADGGGAQLILDNHGNGSNSGAWAAQGPCLQKELSEPIAINDALLIKWTQIDIAHALQFKLLITGEDNVDRWLIYSSNASNHWSTDIGFVDMGANAAGYGEKSFARFLRNDYWNEFHIEPVVVKAYGLSHFSDATWNGDHGGTVKNILYSQAPQFVSLSGTAVWVATSKGVPGPGSGAYYSRINWSCQQGSAPILQYIIRSKLSNSNWQDRALLAGSVTQWQDPSWPLSMGPITYRVIAVDINGTGGISNSATIKQPITGDPIVAQVSDINATAFSNGKKVAIDGLGMLHVTYSSGDTVFYTNSMDDGNEWSFPVNIGTGKNPAIQIKPLSTGKGGHYNVYTEFPSICYINGNTLFNAEKNGTSWSSPTCIYQGQQDEEISYLSYVLNQQTSQAYVGWVSTTPSGSQVLSAPYTPGSSGGQLAPIIVDPGGGSTLFKSPSLAIAKDGGLLTCWSRDGVVKYNGGIDGTIDLSSTDKYSIHPIVSTYGDRTSVIWMEQITPPSKNEPGMFQIVSRDRTSTGWSSEKIISYSDGYDAQFPIAAANGQYAYVKEFGDGDYDINYTGLYHNGWETTTQNISNASGGQSGYPDVIFTPSWPQHKIYFLWTELTNTSAKSTIGLVKIKPLPVDAIPSMTVYPSRYEKSSYTVRRTGTLCYGMGPYQVVDYDSAKLLYHFDNLNKDNKYQVNVTYYINTNNSGMQVSQPSRDQTKVTKNYVTKEILGEEDKCHNNDWRMQLKIDDKELKTTWIPDTTVVQVSDIIPKKYYNDGEIDISIEPKKGLYAICSALEIVEYIDKKQLAKAGSNDQPQSTIVSSYAYCLQQSTPNPTSGNTNILYQLACVGKTNITVYNTIGQVVKTLVNMNQQPGIYSIIWDGKDDRGRHVANGVYIYRLSSGSFQDIKKLVMIK